MCTIIIIGLSTANYTMHYGIKDQLVHDFQFFLDGSGASRGLHSAAPATCVWYPISRKILFIVSYDISISFNTHLSAIDNR